MIEEIKGNLDVELSMAQQMAAFMTELEKSQEKDRKIIGDAIKSLEARIKMLNSSIRDMAKSLTLAQSLPGKQMPTNLEKITFASQGVQVAIKRSDREKFLEELHISEEILKRFRRRSKNTEEVVPEFKKPGEFSKMANRIFLPTSLKMSKSESMKGLLEDLKKSNMGILGTTYISVMLLCTVLSVFVGFLLIAFFFFFSLTFLFPFVKLAADPGFIRLLKLLWLPLLTPLLTFVGFYFYPYTEQRSLSSRINSELPFVVIHMGSISGSGVEPSQIFRIVGKSREYKYTRVEMRKLLNQINVYGYDLVTALRNVAAITPSKKFAEVLNGLSTTISSGGDLKTFFEKRAETLLLEYKLERERFAKTAETFMDIYISVVIATPMILLLLLVLIQVGNFGGGASIDSLAFGIIILVGFMNVIFLWVLSMKQPSY